MTANDVTKLGLEVIGGPLVALAMVAYLAKLLIKQLLSREEMNFTARLKLTADLELERIRTIGGVARIEHEIMLSRLQDHRARVIGRLYAKLIDARDKTTEYLMDIGRDHLNERTNERALAAAMANWSLLNYFERQMVWLPKPCCDNVEALLRQLRGLQQARRFFGYDHTGAQQLVEKSTEALENAWSEIGEKVPAALESLLQEMRALLDPRLQNK